MNKKNVKYWIYIDKFHGKVRDFGDQIAIRCETMEDAEKAAQIFKKFGHENVLAAESIGLSFPAQTKGTCCY